LRAKIAAKDADGRLKATLSAAKSFLRVARDVLKMLCDDSIPPRRAKDAVFGLWSALCGAKVSTVVFRTSLIKALPSSRGLPDEVLRAVTLTDSYNHVVQNSALAFPEATRDALMSELAKKLLAARHHALIPFRGTVLTFDLLALAGTLDRRTVKVGDVQASPTPYAVSNFPASLLGTLTKDEISGTATFYAEAEEFDRERTRAAEANNRCTGLDDASPADFWERRRGEYVQLAQIGLRASLIKPSSACVERAFSRVARHLPRGNMSAATLETIAWHLAVPSSMREAVIEEAAVLGDPRERRANRARLQRGAARARGVSAGSPGAETVTVDDEEDEDPRLSPEAGANAGRALSTTSTRPAEPDDDKEASESASHECDTSDPRDARVKELEAVVGDADMEVSALPDSDEPE
jgi:hypothetical protein